MKLMVANAWYPSMPMQAIVTVVAPGTVTLPLTTPKLSGPESPVGSVDERDSMNAGAATPIVNGAVATLAPVTRLKV